MTNDINELFRAVTEHPDFCGGTIWTKRDLAYAIYRDDLDELDQTTEAMIATVTEDERQAAIRATEDYVFRDYSWFEAMLDCDVFPDRTKEAKCWNCEVSPAAKDGNGDYTAGGLCTECDSNIQSAAQARAHEAGKHANEAGRNHGLLMGCVKCSEEVK